VNPISGATLTVEAIAGHRDWNPSECPGDRLYELLPAVRARVARLVASITPARTASVTREVPLRDPRASTRGAARRSARSS